MATGWGKAGQEARGDAGGFGNGIAMANVPLPAARAARAAWVSGQVHDCT
ncbi:hypothetical protein J2S03_000366 [Alicyclobacillus cycloheptanicus]|uniref:Uncharacterized protein n=1 Tax=Alicyclobacillus cycloheptanicus TaxID=1457 RepID=A0ABT9XE36_9BACL|nr:hypothetical protein [Alicyclobacillus cycloheptanicus]